MSEWLLDIFVPGLPRAQGSLKHVGKGRMVHSAGLIKWRDTITRTLQQWTGTYFGAWEPLDGPVEVRAVFYLPRPKTVKRQLPTASPDVDKLARGLLDSLAPKKNRLPAEGAFLLDDSRVVDLRVSKRYVHDFDGDGAEPGVRIKVRRIRC